MKVISMYVVFLILCFVGSYTINFSGEKDPLADLAGFSNYDKNPQIIIKAENIIEEKLRNNNPAILNYLTDLKIEDTDKDRIINKILKGHKISDKLMLLNAVKNGNLESNKEFILTSLIEDESFFIKDEVLKYAGDLNITGLTAQAEKGLKNPDSYIASRCAWYLGTQQHKKAAPEITALLYKEKGWVSLKTAEALALLGEEEGIEYLNDALNNAKSPKLRAYAAAMLLQTGDQTVKETLIEMTSDFDDRVSFISNKALAEEKQGQETDSSFLSDIMALGDIVSAEIAINNAAKTAHPRKLTEKASQKAVDERKKIFREIIYAKNYIMVFESALKSPYLKELSPALLNLAWAADQEKAFGLARHFIKINKQAEFPPAFLRNCFKIFSNKAKIEDLKILEPYLEDDTEFTLPAAVSAIVISEKTI